MGKTSLIIGCSGQDGSILCKSLLESGQEVIGTSRKNVSEHKNHQTIGIAGAVDIQCVSMENLAEVVNLLKRIQPEHIYNFAAQSSVGLSFQLPHETQTAIVNTTTNILEACRLVGYEGKVFFSGSGEIFGETQQAANLGSNINIKSPYSASKYQSLILSQLYKESYGINAITGIFFNHESHLRDTKFVTQKIINGAIECTKNKNHKLILGNLEISRDWGWAEDYMEGVQIMMNSNNIEDQIICTGKLTTLKEFIKITFDKFGLDWRDHVISDKRFFRQSEIKKSYGDPAKMEKDLGWKAKTDIKEIIEKLINLHPRLNEIY